MQQIDFSKNSYERTPKAGRIFASMVRGLDYVFGKAFNWHYNPFAQSGVVVVVLFLILLVTGLGLIFFYRLGAPYESMVFIQNHVWLGRWLRTAHRYATDLGMVFLGFHIFKMFAQGKTWGPRALAWISGVIMLGMYFLSTMTGYILVWDEFGLNIARGWARFVDSFNLLPSPLSRAFSGDVPLATSFFFMNLFLHVAIPLGIVAALWLHTSKVAKPRWIPERKVIWFISISLFLGSVFAPAALNEKADVLQVSGRVYEDILFSWWIVLQESAGRFTFLGIVFVTAVLALLAPWIWRPSAEKRPSPSIHKEEFCEGCTQCVQDCPFDSIEMVPRTIGTGSAMVARVNTMDCVSCGICSGSCSAFAIGPENRSGRDQLVFFRDALKGFDLEKAIEVRCKNQWSGPSAGNSEDGKQIFLVDCVGSIHPGVVTFLSTHSKQVFLSACTPDTCEMRLGSQIEWERVYDGRDPGIPNRVSIENIVWNAHKPNKNFFSNLLAVVSSLAILFVIVRLSAFPVGHETDGSFLRLAWRYPIQKIEICKDLSAEQIALRPAHMRTTKECAKRILPLNLKVWVDGQEQFTKLYRPAGLREDRPLLIEEQLSLSPGMHDVQVKMTVEEMDSELNAAFKTEFEKGRARLITISTLPNQTDQKIFVIR